MSDFYTCKRNLSEKRLAPLPQTRVEEQRIQEGLFFPLANLYPPATLTMATHFHSIL